LQFGSIPKDDCGRREPRIRITRRILTLIFQLLFNPLVHQAPHTVIVVMVNAITGNGDLGESVFITSSY
jgi:hypothetical protein